MISIPNGRGRPILAATRLTVPFVINSAAISNNAWRTRRNQSAATSVDHPMIGLRKWVPNDVSHCIVGVNQACRLSTIGAITARSHSVMTAPGPSSRNTQTQITAQNANATSHAYAARFSSCGNGGGSPLGRRRR